MTKQDIAYFTSFCIEQYKTEKGISGAEAVRELDKSSTVCCNILPTTPKFSTHKADNG